MEEGIGIGEGVEDITLSFGVPCECLSFRLRNLLIVLMLGQVLQDKSLCSGFIEEKGGAASDASIRKRCLTILTNRLWDVNVRVVDEQE